MTEIGTFHGFVDRGDPAAGDFSQADLTMNDAFHDLNLSAIVPTNAQAVILSIFAITPGSGGGSIVFRKKGSSNQKNVGGCIPNVAATAYLFETTVAIGPSGIIQYKVEVEYSLISITVRGWLI